MSDAGSSLRGMPPLEAGGKPEAPAVVDLTEDSPRRAGGQSGSNSVQRIALIDSPGSSPVQPPSARSGASDDSDDEVAVQAARMQLPSGAAALADRRSNHHWHAS